MQVALSLYIKLECCAATHTRLTSEIGISDLLLGFSIDLLISFCHGVRICRLLITWSGSGATSLSLFVAPSEQILLHLLSMINSRDVELYLNKVSLSIKTCIFRKMCINNVSCFICFNQYTLSFSWVFFFSMCKKTKRKQTDLLWAFFLLSFLFFTLSKSGYTTWIGFDCICPPNWNLFRLQGVTSRETRAHLWPAWSDTSLVFDLSLLSDTQAHTLCALPSILLLGDLGWRL